MLLRKTTQTFAEQPLKTQFVQMEKNTLKDSTLHIGGNLNIGDTTITNQQNHSGTGDNVAGDKVGGDKVMRDKITNEYHY